MIKEQYNRDVIEELQYADEECLFFHGCNAKGVMGAGVAKQVKKNWPDVFDKYQDVCSDLTEKELVGEIIPAHRNGIWFINGITQKDFGKRTLGDSFAKIKWIQECIERIEENLKHDPTFEEMRFMSVRVGCGLGGLEWQDVKTIFEKSKLPWEIYYL